jgi:hypothetical protein
MVHAIISHNHNHNHNLTIHNHSSHCLYTTHPTLALPYISLPHSLLEEYNEWKIKNLKVQFILFLKNLGLDITRVDAVIVVGRSIKNEWMRSTNILKC